MFLFFFRLQSTVCSQRWDVSTGSCRAPNGALNRLREAREELTMHVQVTRRDVVQPGEQLGRWLQGWKLDSDSEKTDTDENVCEPLLSVAGYLRHSRLTWAYCSSWAGRVALLPCHGFKGTSLLETSLIHSTEEIETKQKMKLRRLFYTAPLIQHIEEIVS